MYPLTRSSSCIKAPALGKENPMRCDLTGARCSFANHIPQHQGIALIRVTPEADRNAFFEHLAARHD